MSKVEKTATVNSQSAYSDSGLATLFRTHVAFMNTEATLIWMRFNVMLLANAVFLGLLTRERAVAFGAAGQPSASTLWWTSFGACFFGLALCLAWMILTHVGWKYLTERFVASRDFTWDGHVNPANIGVPKAGKDYIRYAAYGVIGLFALAYVIGLGALIL